MEHPLLELRNVTKDYIVGGWLGLISKRQIRAVDNVSFTLCGEKPEVIALVGESGSGKSTIAKIILGLEKPTFGEVLFKGYDIRSWLKKNKIEYWRNVQAVFQDPYQIYNPFYRVERVLYKSVKKFGLAPSRREAENLIKEAMRSMGLRPEDILGRYPHQLSGGERQRLMLVRIFLIKPKILVADEPVSMIDVSLRAIFLKNLQKLKDELKMTTLFITHDLNIANYISNNIMVLCHGRMVETGQTKIVIKDPLHPYTKSLIEAIPMPNPKKRWKEEVKLKEISLKSLMERRNCCIYSYRCPYSMRICEENMPPLIKVGPGRSVACFIYSEKA